MILFSFIKFSNLGRDAWTFANRISVPDPAQPASSSSQGDAVPRVDGDSRTFYIDRAGEHK